MFLFPPEIVSQLGESDISMECKFKIWSENLVVHVRWYKHASLEMKNQIDTVALGEKSTKLTSSGKSAASTEICGCSVFGTRINSTDTEYGTQQTVPSK